MSQLEKLKALQESKSKTANLSLFNNVVVIDVGIEPLNTFQSSKINLETKSKTKMVRISVPKPRTVILIPLLNLALGKWLKLFFQKR